MLKKNSKFENLSLSDLDDEQLHVFCEDFEKALSKLCWKFVSDYAKHFEQHGLGVFPATAKRNMFNNYLHLANDSVHLFIRKVKEL